MTTNYQRDSALLRTTWHLTPRELWRLLHRYDLSPAVQELIWDDLAQADDCLAEQAAERGVGTYQTPLDRYLRANPVFGCAAAPVVDDYDDVPF